MSGAEPDAMRGSEHVLAGEPSAGSALPGTVKPKRLRPKLAYELLACGTAGHELIGTDAAQITPEDRAVVREGAAGTRWHRCLRCDSWLPLPVPDNPTVGRVPAREELELPLRGRALRDKVVLRVIAVDRALHFLILGAVAVAILIFAARQGQLRGQAFKVLADLQGGLGSSSGSQHGLLGKARHLFDIQSGTLTKIGFVVAGYALLEGLEAVGLWLQKRWAEYLTFLATVILVPVEIYELTESLSPLKLLTLIINLAVVVYLLFAKRLFGLRGGGKAEAREREEDSGWPALDAATPS